MAFSPDFRKILSINFHQDPSSGSRVLTWGRTDRHDEANRRFSQFCESAYNNTLFRKLDLFPSIVEKGGKAHWVEPDRDRLFANSGPGDSTRTFSSASYSEHVTSGPLLLRLIYQATFWEQYRLTAGIYSGAVISESSTMCVWINIEVMCGNIRHGSCQILPLNF